MERSRVRRLARKARALEAKGLTKGVTVVALALAACVTEGAVHYGLLGAVAVLFCIFIAETEAAARDLRIIRKEMKR